jgi:tRNA(adenine34) deaminase
MASKVLKNYRLKDCVLFSTLEPCCMCASAIVHARIRKLYFSTREPKSGAVVSNINFFENNFLNHKVEIHEGILKAVSARLIKDFFKARRVSV